MSKFMTYEEFNKVLQIKEAMDKYKLDQIQEDFND